MKELFLTSIAALFLATGAAHAIEYQGKLPKPVQRLPSYPPVVCVAPNWAAESCEDRQPQYWLAALADLVESLKRLDRSWIATATKSDQPRPWNRKWPGEAYSQFSPQIKVEDPAIPPIAYDHPFRGKLTIERDLDQDTLHERCHTRGVTLGCTLIPAANECIILLAKQDAFNFIRDMLAKKDSLKRVGEPDPQSIIRHETGHCNGWPADHPGARFVDEANR